MIYGFDMSQEIETDCAENCFDGTFFMTKKEEEALKLLNSSFKNAPFNYTFFGKKMRPSH